MISLRLGHVFWSYSGALFACRLCSVEEWVFPITSFNNKLLHLHINKTEKQLETKKNCKTKIETKNHLAVDSPVYAVNWMLWVIIARQSKALFSLCSAGISVSVTGCGIG